MVHKNILVRGDEKQGKTWACLSYLLGNADKHENTHHLLVSRDQDEVSSAVNRLRISVALYHYDHASRGFTLPHGSSITLITGPEILRTNTGRTYHSLAFDDVHLYDDHERDQIMAALKPMSNHKLFATNYRGLWPSFLTEHYGIKFDWYFELT